MSDEQPLPASWNTPCVVRIRQNAPSLSSLYFGLPVYLVGGSLRDEDPRDIDVVIVLPDDLFIRCYGDEPDQREVERAVSKFCGDMSNDAPSRMYRRWLTDCAKHNEHLTRWCCRRVDFKTQIESLTTPRFGSMPRYRIDDATPRVGEYVV